MRDLEEAHRWYERSAAAGCPAGRPRLCPVAGPHATDPGAAGAGGGAPAPCRRRRPADGVVSARHDDRTRHGHAGGPCGGDPVVPAGGREGQPAGQARWGLALMEGGPCRPIRSRASPGCAVPRSPAIRRRRRWSAISTPRAASCRRIMPRRRCGSAAPLRLATAAAARALGMLHLTGAGVVRDSEEAARLVPRLGGGGRPDRAGRSGQPAAAGAGRHRRRDPHPRVVRAGRRVRRPGGGVQFRRLPGRGRRRRARRPQGGAMAAPRRRWRGERAVLVRPDAGRRARRGPPIRRRAAPGSSAPPMSAWWRPRSSWRR